jgi:hypothetical protein
MRTVWAKEDACRPSHSDGATPRKNCWGMSFSLVSLAVCPKDAKPFKGVGSGVLGLALQYASDAYRVVLAVPDRQADLCFARLSEEIEERWEQAQPTGGGYRSANRSEVCSK